MTGRLRRNACGSIPLIVRFLPVLLLASVAACASRTAPRNATPAESVTVTTGGSNSSMIHAARVAGGIILIDLGWWGAADALSEALTQLDASTHDVSAVFLTHSHRDHIGAWRLVRHAPFHLAEAEMDLLFGAEEHGGWIPRWADRISAGHLPEPGELAVRPFSVDTFFTFGTDTLRAFLVPGHTPGSTAYLFRGTLYAGDAIARTWWSGFRPARPGYSADTEQAMKSLISLRTRLQPFDVRWICSAHLQCGEPTPEFWADLLER